MIEYIEPATACPNNWCIYSADSVKYKSKPEGGTIGGIRKRLAGTAAHKGSTIQDLARLIEQGVTVQGAQLRDKLSPEETDTKARHLRQQVFIVDIDNTETRPDPTTGKPLKDSEGNTLNFRLPEYIPTPAEILTRSRAAGVEPAIIAPSFSNGKADPNGDPIPKYHVVYISEQPLTNAEECEHILKGLRGIFGAAADPACTDPARIIFGTTAENTLTVQAATNPPAALLALAPAPEEPSEPLPLEAPAPSSSDNQSEALAYDDVITEEQAAPRRTRSKSKPADFDPDVLLSMIPTGRDYNGGNDFPYIRILSSFKAMGGSKEVAAQWAAQYHKAGETEQEARKAFESTWKGLKGSKATRGTLIKAAEALAPAEFQAYQAALTPSKPRKTAKPKPTPQTRAQSETRAQSGAPPENGAEVSAELLELTEEQGGAPAWYPLEYPEYLEKPANYVDFMFIDDKDKIHVDTYLLADNLRKTSNYIFVRGANPSEPIRRFWYKRGVYKLVNDEFIKDKLRKRLKVFGSAYCLKRYIEEAFYHLCLDECYHTDSELNADPALINFENGILNINTLELTPHTAEYLSTVQIPCKWEAGKELRDCPTFAAFISRLANYDSDSTATLIEYIGAVLSNVDGSRFKKALFLRGAGNCGKSKYIELLRRLLSDEYYATASLEKLESRFGAYSLYNRRLIGDPDIKYLKVAELNTFKQATGGDPLQLEQKGKMPFSFKYTGFMIFGCNELPLFGGDNGKWVYDRMLLIRCGDPVTEQERDPHLLEKLYAERAAIVSVAVQYLRACIKRKYRFTEGISSQHLLATYRNENDPVRAFLADCCVLREEGAPLNGDIQQRDFYRAYCNWYDDNGNRSRPSVQQFRRALTHASDVYDIKQLEKYSHGKRYYIYTLTPEARQRYGIEYFDNAYHDTGL